MNPALYGNAVTPLQLQATAIGYITLCHIRPGSGKVTAGGMFWVPIPSLKLLFMGSCKNTVMCSIKRT